MHTLYKQPARIPPLPGGKPPKYGIHTDCFSGFLSNLYKSSLEAEKRWFSPEFGEKSSLHLEIGMIILYLLKIAPFGCFCRKIQIFPVENNAILYFSILTKWAGSQKPPLVQNKQGGRRAGVRNPRTMDECLRSAIKIHFGGI